MTKPSEPAPAETGPSAAEGTPADVPWTLRPGEAIARKELHARFGGRSQGGIGPSAKSPHVFVFTDPAAGEQHGYYDDWMPDGLFHYTGEGQRGDQRMVSGNATVLRHREEGRALRVFEGARGVVTYRGEFAVDPENPWYEADAPETDDGPLRKVIVFRLRPVDTAPQPPTTTLGRLHADAPDPVTAVPLESTTSERSYVQPRREPYEAERAEARLVAHFSAHLARHGHAAHRHQILPPGESRPLFTDLYAPDLGLLVEAKGSVTRENVRMAVGQLADYGRFLPAAHRAVLLPSRPRADLLALVASQGGAVLWPEGDGYGSTVVGLLP
ncbi:restriction endonuclease [Streptomyces sp. HSW2009]|uniref:restriction endonuclease n=1 Tax=Streptomyces sp. HSW2009 TaxID=3142890 RepID=UPI0032F03109